MLLPLLYFDTFVKPILGRGPKALAAAEAAPAGGQKDDVHKCSKGHMLNIYHTVPQDLLDHGFDSFNNHLTCDKCK